MVSHIDNLLCFFSILLRYQPDPTDNFMSYAYDNCRNRFTDGQFERMLAMFELYRYDPNVVVSGPPPVAPPPTPSPVAEPTRSPVAAPTRTVEPKCFNTARKRDSGCDTGRNKVCVKADDTEPASGEPGTKCVRCVNSHTGNKRDSGCGGIRPLCAYSTTPGDVPPLGKPGTRCVSIL